MVVPEGLEPPTPTLGKWRSIRLSYGTMPRPVNPLAREVNAEHHPDIVPMAAMDRRRIGPP